MLKAFTDYLAWRFHRFQDAAFDRFYRVDTAGGVGEFLGEVDSTNKEFAVPYEPVQVFMFRRMLRDAAIDPSDFTFVDLGSGKGRALLLACLAGFERVVGVEFSPALHRIAEENSRALSRKLNRNPNISLECEDASNFSLPDDNIVVFLYNPFFGPVMQAVAQTIARFVDEGVRDVVILYRNPACSPLFDAMESMVLVKDSGSYRIYRNRKIPT